MDAEYPQILDQRRQSEKRDGCLCCLVHNNFKPEQSTKRSFLSVVFGKVGQTLTNKCVQFIIILMTGFFLSIGIWGAMSLTQVNYLLDDCIILQLQLTASAVIDDGL